MFKSEEKKLGDICSFEFGTRITKMNNSIEYMNNYNGPVYPVYGGGGITFETNKYNRESNTLIISRFGVSPKCVRIINDKYFLNDSGMTINNYKINKRYLNYYLLINQDKLYEYASGQAQKNMQTNKLFREFKVLVPSLKDQEVIVSMIDEINNEENDFHKNIQSIKENIKRMYECVEYIVDKTNNENDKNEEEDNNEENEEEDNEEEDNEDKNNEDENNEDENDEDNEEDKNNEDENNENENDEDNEEDENNEDNEEDENNEDNEEDENNEDENNEDENDEDNEED